MGEGAERIVFRRGDLGEQPELRDAQPHVAHARRHELGDAAGGQPGVPHRATGDRLAGVADEALGRRLP